MIALKVEKIGDQVAVVLTEEALEVLNLEVGGTLHLERGAEGGVIVSVHQEVWLDDPHARGRAFLKRYTKALERL